MDFVSVDFDTVELQSLLEQASPDLPCGPNLEYDPGFMQLELDVLGKPEVQYGDTIVAAVPPEWKLIRRTAFDLLQRSRDLRILMYLLHASLALQGMTGLADGLGLLEKLLAQRWDTLHPQLDPDDDLDPTLRLNCLSMLCDKETILKTLKESTLISFPSLGPVSLRTLAIVNGELPAPAGMQAISLNSLSAAMALADPAGRLFTLAATERALASTSNIEVMLVRQVGNTQALDLGDLIRALRCARDFLAVESSHEAGTVMPAAVQQGMATGGHAAPTLQHGEVGNREDVTRLLDCIVRYYERFEPSSPVPLLLLRARRLVPKSFAEIMDDLVPDAMPQWMVGRVSDMDGYRSE